MCAGIIIGKTNYRWAPFREWWAIPPWQVGYPSVRDGLIDREDWSSRSEYTHRVIFRDQSKRKTDSRTSSLLSTAVRHTLQTIRKVPLLSWKVNISNFLKSAK